MDEARALAESRGLEVRVLREDDVHRGQKMDLRQRRVNLWLDGGRVTEARRF